MRSRLAGAGRAHQRQRWIEVGYRFFEGGGEGDVVVYDGVALFELAVASDNFGTTIATVSGRPLYRLSICGAAPSVTTDAGFRMEVPHGLDALPASDTVIVLPTLVPGEVPVAVLDALRAARSRGRRLSTSR